MIFHWHFLENVFKISSLSFRLSSAASKTSQRSYQVLSSEKLAASLKSANYLGRPYTAPQPTIGKQKYIWARFFLNSVTFRSKTLAVI